MMTAGNYRPTLGIVFKGSEILNLRLQKIQHYRSITASKTTRQMIKVTEKETRFLDTRDKCWAGRGK